MNQSLLDLFREARAQFPALDRENSEGYILFDNAAGAQLPESAITEVEEHLRCHNAQKGSVFARQERMQQAIYDLRAAVADLMGTNKDRIALGLNATSLIGLIAHHLARDLKPGDLVLTTEFDHMANIWPWEELRERGIQVEAIPISPRGYLDMGALERLLERKPRIVACGWISNATGTPCNIQRVSEMAHAAGALVLVDCVAGAPHRAMAVEEWDVDFAVCSAYKIFGPHLGMAYINPTRLSGWRLGDLVAQDAGKFGLGTSYAAKLELGTQNHEGIAGFRGTLRYLEALGTAAARANGGEAPTRRRERFLRAMEAVREYERGLTRALVETVKAVPGAVLYGEPAAPIVSFNIQGRRPADIAHQLEEEGIEARTGNYLAIPSMMKLAADYGGEAVRVSLVHYNTQAEVQRLAEVLQAL